MKNYLFNKKNSILTTKPFLLQNNNLNLDTSPRPSSKAPSSTSIDENSLELRDVDQDDSMLDELEINKYLVLKKPEEDGPDIRGGHPDALLIHATKANKHGMRRGCSIVVLATIIL